MFPNFKSLSQREQKRMALLKKAERDLENDDAKRQAYSEATWADDVEKNKIRLPSNTTTTSTQTSSTGSSSSTQTGSSNSEGPPSSNGPSGVFSGTNIPTASSWRDRLDNEFTDDEMEEPMRDEVDLSDEVFYDTNTGEEVNLSDGRPRLTMLDGDEETKDDLMDSEVQQYYRSLIDKLYDQIPEMAVRKYNPIDREGDLMKDYYFGRHAVVEHKRQAMITDDNDPLNRIDWRLTYNYIKVKDGRDINRMLDPFDALRANKGKSNDKHAYQQLSYMVGDIVSKKGDFGKSLLKKNLKLFDLNGKPINNYEFAQYSSELKLRKKANAEADLNIDEKISWDLTLKHLMESLNSEDKIDPKDFQPSEKLTTRISSTDTVYQQRIQLVFETLPWLKDYRIYPVVRTKIGHPQFAVEFRLGPNGDIMNQFGDKAGKREVSALYDRILWGMTFSKLMAKLKEIYDDLTTRERSNMKEEDYTRQRQIKQVLNAYYKIVDDMNPNSNSSTPRMKQEGKGLQKIQLAGRGLMGATNEYKNFWNNLRAMTEHSVGDVYKHGAENFLQPDDWYSINFAADSSSAGDGYSNNQCDTTVRLDATLGQTQENRACNSGFVSRLNGTPAVVDTASHNAFSWVSMHSKSIEKIIQQTGRGGFIETATAGQQAIAGTWVYMLKIRLTDLHPLFKERDLVANPQLKLRYRVNTGTVEINMARVDAAAVAVDASPATKTNNMSLSSCSLTSGNVCPIMVASGANGQPMSLVSSTIASKISFSFGALENQYTTTSTIGQYLPYTTTRLHIPFYDLIDPRPIISKPIKTVRYLDCFAQYFKQRAGMGVKVDGQHNAAFNFQLSASLKNVKYLAVVPFAETSAGHWLSSHLTEQFQSPFDSAPWTCQPGASIRNFQVQIGNQNVFSKTHEYDYESFIDEFSKLGAINGDITREMNNGLVDIDRWTYAQRIMVADCSRITEKDVPSSIQVSGVNSCSQGSNYLILAVYEREMEVDRLTGEIVRTD